MFVGCVIDNHGMTTLLDDIFLHVCLTMSTITITINNDSTTNDDKNDLPMSNNSIVTAWSSMRMTIMTMTITTMTMTTTTMTITIMTMTKTTVPI